MLGDLHHIAHAVLAYPVPGDPERHPDELTAPDARIHVMYGDLDGI